MFSDTLRQRMGWLHAWVGFTAGLLLVVIFSCGALTSFDTEITRWMQPELARDPSPNMTEAGINTAIDEVAQMQAHHFIPLIILPSLRDPFLRVVHYDGTSFIGPVIDPASGELRTRRVTYGGTFFYVFHHGLFLPKPWGSIPTEIAALMLLVTLGAGVIIQLKKLLPDFLLFRRHGPLLRSWTDAHILLGVLLVPFMAMMAYTGASIHAMRLFPAMPHNMAREAKKPAMPPVAPLKAPEISRMLHQAEGVFGKGQVGFITFTQNDIRYFRSDMACSIITRDAFIASLSSGETRLERHRADITNVKGWLAGLHYARWARYPFRFLYFIGGLVGSWMMSAGLIIFLMKRRSAHGHRFSFRLGEAAALAVTTALPLAMLAYLAASRVLPGGMINTCHAEPVIFFLIWILASAAASLDIFRGRCFPAWRRQLLAIAVAGMVIPVLDFSTRDTAWHDASLIYPIIDLIAAMLGVLALGGARRLKS